MVVHAGEFTLANSRWRIHARSRGGGENEHTAMFPVQSAYFRQRLFLDKRATAALATLLAAQLRRIRWPPVTNLSSKSRSSLSLARRAALLQPLPAIPFLAAGQRRPLRDFRQRPFAARAERTGFRNAAVSRAGGLDQFEPLRVIHFRHGKSRLLADPKFQKPVDAARRWRTVTLAPSGRVSEGVETAVATFASRPTSPSATATAWTAPARQPGVRPSKNSPTTTGSP